MIIQTLNIIYIYMISQVEEFDILCLIDIFTQFCLGIWIFQEYVPESADVNERRSNKLLHHSQ